MKIKNLSILAVAVLLSAGVAQAQRVSKSDDSIEFRPHWNIQLMGGAGYTIGEANYMQLFSPAAGFCAFSAISCLLPFICHDRKI